MPEFFLELFSEEIPARMQRDAALHLEKICGAALAALKINVVETYYGPRRIALKAILNATTEARQIEERGPRDSAPEAALAGFLGKHKATRENIVTEGGYFLLRRTEPAVPAAALIAAALPAALAKFSWPKSMRWGQSGSFTWVRPLRRLICLLDGDIIPIALGPVTAGNETEGHRFMSPGAFAVSSAEDWQTKLRARHVIADQAERRTLIIDGLRAKAAEHGLTVAEDSGLIDEVTGLVEWPVALTGAIDGHFMDLPPEVRELSMKVNQRYFALRDEAGKPAPFFAFISNLAATDHGKAIIAGNERVLRARLSDARHFWDQDLKTPLDELLPKLDKITFHAKIGTQGERVKRIATLAEDIALALGADAETARQARMAGRLSKADLVTGMVGEFPELQGVMGGYYAEQNPRDWDGALVGPAIATHYHPKGPSDAVPSGMVSISVALADKIDTLREFFAAGEKPTGSGDPYALRRAALGVIRIIIENNLPLTLETFITNQDLQAFILERLRAKLRGEGKRFDILDAVLAAHFDGNLAGTMQRVEAISKMLGTADGMNVHAGIKRAANILRIEDPESDLSTQGPSPDLYRQPEEKALAKALDGVRDEMIEKQLFQNERYEEAMANLASLRPAIDAFFEKVTVNDDHPDIRRNRLRLLASICRIANQIADFSKIEG